jgi:hypothetical protein
MRVTRKRSSVYTALSKSLNKHRKSGETGNACLKYPDAEVCGFISGFRGQHKPVATIVYRHFINDLILFKCWRSSMVPQSVHSARDRGT